MYLLILKSRDSMTPGRPLNHTWEPLPYKMQLKHGLHVLPSENGQINLPIKLGYNLQCILLLKWRHWHFIFNYWFDHWLKYFIRCTFVFQCRFTQKSKKKGTLVIQREESWKNMKHHLGSHVHFGNTFLSFFFSFSDEKSKSVTQDYRSTKWQGWH